MNYKINFHIQDEAEGSIKAIDKCDKSIHRQHLLDMNIVQEDERKSVLQFEVNDSAFLVLACQRCGRFWFRELFFRSDCVSAPNIWHKNSNRRFYFIWNNLIP